MVEELTEFDKDFILKEKELAKKQQEFEVREKFKSKELIEAEKKEEKKNKIVTWIILGLMFLFILFLAYKWLI